MTPPSSVPKIMTEMNLTANCLRRETGRQNWLSARPSFRSSATAVPPMIKGMTSHSIQNKSESTSATVFR